MVGSQEEGWPLGLPPVTFRMRLADIFSFGNGRNATTTTADAASIVLTTTPSFSSLSSSDLDTESTMSFFPEKSITLANLIGDLNSTPVLQQQPVRRSTSSSTTNHNHRWLNSDNRFLSLIRCGRGTADVVDNSTVSNPAQSLGHFLEAERGEGSTENEAKVYINIMYEEAMASGESNPQSDTVNPLFVSVRSPLSRVFEADNEASTASGTGGSSPAFPQLSEICAQIHARKKSMSSSAMDIVRNFHDENSQAVDMATELPSQEVRSVFPRAEGTRYLSNGEAVPIDLRPDRSDRGDFRVLEDPVPESSIRDKEMKSVRVLEDTEFIRSNGGEENKPVLRGFGNLETDRSEECEENKPVKVLTDGVRVPGHGNHFSESESRVPSLEFRVTTPEAKANNRQSECVAELNCVCYIWGFPKNSGTKKKCC